MNIETGKTALWSELAADTKTDTNRVIANLKGEDVDWLQGTIGFTRKKTGVPVIVLLGTESLNLFKDLPAKDLLFPYLETVRAGDRATELRSRCRQFGITGVTLHSYRYAWA